jgi:hypothetical protein
MKYRLKIPGTIRKEDMFSVLRGRYFNIDKAEGKCLPLDETEKDLDMWGPEIPKGWLEPIEEKPVSAEEYAEKNMLYRVARIGPGGPVLLEKSHLSEAFKSGEKNRDLLYKQLVDRVGEALYLMKEHGLDGYEDYTDLEQALKQLEEN